MCSQVGCYVVYKETYLPVRRRRIRSVVYPRSYVWVAAYASYCCGRCGRRTVQTEGIHSTISFVNAAPVVRGLCSLAGVQLLCSVRLAVPQAASEVAKVGPGGGRISVVHIGL